MSSRQPKNPLVPSAPLTLDAKDIYPYTGPLWRVHQSSGAHPAQWNTLRSFGPLVSFRWEPHPWPQQQHLGMGVSYTAQEYTTAFAEVFQSTRIVRLTDRRILSGWRPTRPLALLDLVPPSGWSLRNGASASLPFASRNICRGWAHAIWTELGGELDGLRVPSTITGDPMVVLFARAVSSFPIAPEFSRPLNHSDVATLGLLAARRLTWPIF